MDEWSDHGKQEGRDADSRFDEVDDQRIVSPVKFCIEGVNCDEVGGRSEEDVALAGRRRSSRAVFVA